MSTEKNIYESPRLDVVEVTIEQAILNSSIPDMGDGGDLLN